MNDFRKEPYFDFFVQNGYSYVGSGWMHNIFEKGNRIYKIVKSEFIKFDSLEMYQLEKACMDFLRENGYIQTVKVYKIYAKNELVKGFCVLEEEKAVGFSRKRSNISKKQLYKILDFYMECLKVHGRSYGAYSIEIKDMFNSWDAYLKKLLSNCEYVIKELGLRIDYALICDYFNREYRYDGPPALLIMDPNVENFFFSNEEISSIIDIDHPIFGDPLYQWSFFTTNVVENKLLDEEYQKIGFVFGDKDYIDYLIQKGVINHETIKTICYYSIVFCLNDLFFRMKFQEENGNEQFNIIMERLMHIYKNSLKIF